MFFMTDSMYVAGFVMQLILELQVCTVDFAFTCADIGVLCVSSPVPEGYFPRVSF